MSRAASNKCYALTRTRIVQSESAMLDEPFNDREAKKASTERLCLLLAHEGQPRGSPYSRSSMATRFLFSAHIIAHRTHPIPYRTRSAVYPEISLSYWVPMYLPVFHRANVISRKKRYLSERRNM
jgi:hypothetical protein